MKPNRLGSHTGNPWKASERIRLPDMYISNDASPISWYAAFNISWTFSCDACTWYTLIKMHVLMSVSEVRIFLPEYHFFGILFSYSIKEKLFSLQHIQRGEIQLSSYYSNRHRKLRHKNPKLYRNSLIKTW